MIKVELTSFQILLEVNNTVVHDLTTGEIIELVEHGANEKESESEYDAWEEEFIITCLNSEGIPEEILRDHTYYLYWETRYFKEIEDDRIKPIEPIREIGLS